MSSPRVLAFAGSLRKGSWNKKLIQVAAEDARAAGAELTLVDIRDLPLPVFDEDLESEKGAPASAVEWKRLFLANDALLLSAPEYNSSITAALKNVLDWVSRPAPNEAAFAPFLNKVAGLMAASPGALGGLRGLVHVRAILANLQMIVLPQQVAIMRAHEAFDDSGRLKDSKQAASIRSLAEGVVRVSGSLK